MKIELLVSIIGTIIALSAMATTVWQGFLTRRHNRLSVRPMLRVDRIIAENKASLLLANRGVGPAIIISMKFFVDGKVIEKKDSIPPGVLVLQKIGLDARNFKVFEFLPPEPFSAGEKQELFESIGKISDETFVKKAFDRISVIIEYKSFYEDKYTFDNTK